MRLGVLNKCPSSFIPASDRIVIIKIRPPKIKTHAPCIITTTTTTITRTISDQIALRERDTQIGSTRVVKKKRGGFTPPQFPALLS